jgi:N-sulfoglucosamine sulfohydrolase
MGADMRSQSNGNRSRRDLLKGVAAGPFMARPARAAEERPNILYLHSHDTGRYVQPYGYGAPAPNLQRLAGDGILFRHAFDAAPTCSPSRASLLTGQCPHNNGMLGLAHRGFSLDDYHRHILHTLRPHDYRAALAGVQHIARDPKVIGYDEIVPTRSTRAEHVRPAAIEFLKRAGRQPFWLEVGFFETHREFHEPGPREDPRYCAPPAPIADTPETRRDMAGFHASARVLDDAIGDILNALESTGLARNTLVICTTDHGPAFPAMKCNLTAHGTGVFMILRGPGGFSGGRSCEAMVSQLDLFPPICELLKIEKPSWLQGESLLPLMRGEKQQLHDEIFAEVNYHAAYEPGRAVRTQRYNYIRRFGGRQRPVLPNCDDGLSKDLWLKNGWREMIVPEEQLYDTVFDPNETRNLAGDPRHAPALADMRKRLDAWMQRTDDPLLKGPVQAPSGAMINDADGTSPREQPKRV